MTFSATVDVTGAAPYKVRIGHDLTNEIISFAFSLRPAKVAIVTQPALAQYAQQLAEKAYKVGIEPVIIKIPDAEQGKTLGVAENAWDIFGDKAFGRRDLVIGLGGGAATDVAGFIAAAWVRGIGVIQVPTTLLAMVDAAVGGKTGINTGAGKNLVGAFHEPKAVFIDLEMLKSLPAAEIIAGSAEIIKTGFIADPVILERYEHDPQRCLAVDGYLPELIQRSVAVKAAVVGEDLKEAGLREILNYGHTFGHAVELRENFSWRHGNAVAVGMMFIAQLAHMRELIDADLVERHRRIIMSVGLPTTYIPAVFEELYLGMTRDKKNRDGSIRFVALTNVGECTRIEDASYAELQSAYEKISA